MKQLGNLEFLSYAPHWPLRHPISSLPSPPLVFDCLPATWSAVQNSGSLLPKTRNFTSRIKLFVDGSCFQWKIALAVAWARQMSKFQELKRELSILEKTFGSRHEHFRVEANGLDEVTYRFLTPNGEHVVHCNIYVSQVWFLVTVDKPIYDVNYESLVKVF